jgi:hypothetical protein
METTLDDEAARDVPMEGLYVRRALVAGHVLREGGERFSQANPLTDRGGSGHGVSRFAEYQVHRRFVLLASVCG